MVTGPASATTPAEIASDDVLTDVPVRVIPCNDLPVSVAGLGVVAVA